MANLDIRTKKAILRIADALEDINAKLDHILWKEREGYLSSSLDSRLRFGK